MSKKVFSLISALICILALCGCTEYPEEKFDPIPRVDLNFYETINDIDWTVTYRSDTKEIISISGYYSEYDQSSKFYKEMVLQHGDSNIFLSHSFTLTGKPLEDDWYLIEQLEQYISPDWDGSRILMNRTTRYEEKLIFTKAPN